MSVVTPMATFGRESLVPGVAVPFPGSTDPATPSGFAPYGLTRLCRETGGLLHIAPGSSKPKLEAARMRPYAPSYESPKRFAEELKNNPARAVLLRTVQAFDRTLRDDPLVGAVLRSGGVPSPAGAPNLRIPTLRLQFDAPTVNELRVGLTEAQRPSAILEYQLHQLAAELDAVDAADFDEPRWRANYDLTVGRLAALRTRTTGYVRSLAAMKSSPLMFEKPNGNAWRLVPSKEIATGPATRKLAAFATKTLERVIDEHDGTPWALLAERELRRPQGWTWKEQVVAGPDDDSTEKPPTPKRPGI